MLYPAELRGQTEARKFTVFQEGSLPQEAAEQNSGVSEGVTAGRALAMTERAVGVVSLIAPGQDADRLLRGVLAQCGQLAVAIVETGDFRCQFEQLGPLAGDIVISYGGNQRIASRVAGLKPGRLLQPFASLNAVLQLLQQRHLFFYEGFQAPWVAARQGKVFLLQDRLEGGEAMQTGLYRGCEGCDELSVIHTLPVVC